jgi:hypothetical protein
MCVCIYVLEGQQQQLRPSSFLFFFLLLLGGDAGEYNSSQQQNKKTFLFLILQIIYFAVGMARAGKYSGPCRLYYTSAHITPNCNI